MRKIIFLIALVVVTSSCTQRYRIRITQHQNLNNAFYTPEAKRKFKGYFLSTWVQGTSVLKQEEALDQINEWKKDAEYIKKNKDVLYINVK